MTAEGKEKREKKREKRDERRGKRAGRSFFPALFALCLAGLFFFFPAAGISISAQGAKPPGDGAGQAADGGLAGEDTQAGGTVRDGKAGRTELSGVKLAGNDADGSAGQTAADEPDAGGDPAADGADVQVALEADYGFNGRAREGRYLPIRVSLSNKGEEDFSGSIHILTLESSMEVYQYEYPVRLKAGADGKEEYYIPLGVKNDQVFLTLLDGAGNELVKKRLKLDISSESATMFVGALSDSPDGLSYLDGAGLNYGTLRAELIPITAGDIPENELGLDQFDLIAVNDFSWDTLTKAQEEAVFSWVREGGTLLFGTGEELDRNLGRLKEEFLDVGSITFLSQEVNLKEDGGQGQEGPSLTLPCADFTVKEGRIILTDSGSSLLTKRPEGNGQIVLAAFDLAGLAPLCAQVPSLLEPFYGYVLGEDTIQYLAQDQYYSLSNLYYSIQALINTGNVDRLPNVGLYTAVILVYIGAIGPGLYMCLKKKSRQGFYMAGVAVLAVAFTGVIYAMGAKTRFREPFFTYAAVESYGEGGVEKETYINVRSPYNTPYAVALNPDYTVRPITKNYYYDATDPIKFTGNEKYQTALAEEEGRTEVRVRDLTAFEPKLFSLKKREGLIGQALSGNVTFFEGKLSGSVANHSGGRLEDAVLLLYGKAVFLGDLEPGESVELDGLEPLSYPVSYKYAVAQMASGADQYTRTDITDPEYLKAQDRAKLLSFYMESSLNEYFSGARLLAFSPDAGEPDFLADSGLEAEGQTLMTAELSLNQRQKETVYRCVLEQYPEVLSGSYDQMGNTLYVGEPSEPLVLEYFLGNDLEIESLSFDWMSPQFVDNPKYPYLEKFEGSVYFYNYNTGKNDRLDLAKREYTREELLPYLSPSNSITVKYSGEAGDDTVWNMILPVLYVTGREK